MVKLLLDHGADPNKGFPAPFFQASNNTEIASLLSSYGAKAGSQLFCKNTPNKNYFFNGRKRKLPEPAKTTSDKKLYCLR